ncbi:hypothetical protein ABTQ33_02760 [Paucilactobacillus suebicus]|uniref:Uncharacterized protein n=1 Tax=Paucilactobacillus suebicus DSM 5007 = KCTC 3549 TaxID=1423807 RepID=A0A0R1W5E3_9LACO|nr:hypothetical protein [Paucilactobacillus suebicus]KRM13016.1 hypothetical protein FD16_GL001705 [Paucilactobacillus suebicus DSM 5007 = KCTC 3549]
MDIDSMDRDALLDTLHKAQKLPEDEKKVAAVRRQRDEFLAPYFEETEAGRQAKQARKDALNKDDVKDLRQQLRIADERMKLAQHPVEIQKKFKTRSIIAVSVLVVLGLIALIYGKFFITGSSTSNFGGTTKRLVTSIYTMFFFLAIFYGFYRYFYWRKYRPQLVKYAQKKKDELKPVQAKLDDIKTDLAANYDEAIEPFAQSYNSDDADYREIISQLNQQEQIVKEDQAALETIPENVRNVKDMNHFTKSLEAGHAETWQQLMEAHDKQERQREEIRRKEEAAKQAEANKLSARQRNRNNGQQHHKG